jgi:hypothetical protein
MVWPGENSRVNMILQLELVRVEAESDASSKAIEVDSRTEWNWGMLESCTFSNDAIMSFPSPSVGRCGR